MRRLYLQIFLGFIAMLLVCMAVFSSALWLLRDEPEERHAPRGAVGVLAQLLPPDLPQDQVQAEVERYGEAFRARITLRRRDGSIIAAAGEPLPPPPPGMRGGPLQLEGGPPAFVTRLSDGRVLTVQRPGRPPPPRNALAALAAAVVALSIGALLLSRRITRRLEKLQHRVEALGQGDLTARVDIEGSDEVAKLAASFNRSAEQIERLVAGQREMLATASHELRSPLTRLSLALELLSREPRPELLARARADIAELDELIEELLMASRLDANVPLAADTVDLLALAAEEASRVGASVSLETAPDSATPLNPTLTGDARLLRRLLRNLLENAQRYAGGTPIAVTLRGDGADWCLRVEDSGPGVPEAERERIFAPFYRPAGTRETGRGVGLGLSLVRRIAQHHGGDARYVARPGGGACFEVRLSA